jgi:hypothetical protein
LLQAADIPHAVMGGIAVCLHGCQRNTVDLDLLVRAEDAESIRSILKQASFVWHAESGEFRSRSGIAVQFLVAGDRAGTGSEVRPPDPKLPAIVTEIEGLPVLSLAGQSLPAGRGISDGLTRFLPTWWSRSRTTDWGSPSHGLFTSLCVGRFGDW